MARKVCNYRGNYRGQQLRNGYQRDKGTDRRKHRFNKVALVYCNRMDGLILRRVYFTMVYPILIFKEGGVKLYVYSTNSYMVQVLDEPGNIHTKLSEAIMDVQETLLRLDIKTETPLDEVLIMLEDSRERVYGRLTDCIREGLMSMKDVEKLEREVNKDES